MKTYDWRAIRDGLTPEGEDEYVPTHIAKGLYEALENLEHMATECDDGQYMDYPNARGVFEEARAALSAADEEE